MTLWIKQGHGQDSHTGWDSAFLLGHEAADSRSLKLLRLHLLPEVRRNQTEGRTGVHNGMANENVLGKRLKFDSAEEADVENSAMQ